MNLLWLLERLGKAELEKELAHLLKAHSTPAGLAALTPLLQAAQEACTAGDGPALAKAIVDLVFSIH